MTSPVIKGYTPDQAEIGAQTVSGDSSDLDFTVVYAKNAPTITTESKTINETIHYVYKDGTTAHDDYVAKPVEFTRQVSTDAVTGEKTYGSWSADQSFAAVTSPVIKGYTPDQAEIGAQTVSGDSSDLDFTVVYAKNAPTITTESKTINETIHYVYKDGTTAHDDYVAKPVEFTRQVSTDAVTGEKTYGSWSADQSFAAVTSPVIKGYTPDQAEIGAQTVSGDSSDLDFTVVYAKNAPTITTESKTINETIHYVYKDGTTAHDDYVAKPVEFTRQVSTDAVTGEKTYGSWSADQSFAAVTSPVIKGYTPDQAEIGAQTVSGDSSDLDFTVVYAKNAPTITTESKTINETIHYVYKDGTTAHDDYVAKPVEFTRQVSTDAVTGEKTYGSWSADQSFAAVTSPVIKGYTPDQAEIGAQTVSGDSSDLDFTVVYTKDAPTKPVNPIQPTTPAKPVNPSQPATPAKPVNPSQPATPTKPVQAGQAAATNFVDQRLPQTGETDQQHMTLSGLLLLAMSSLLGLFGMTKRQRKE
ncbi:MucBP domain-containing protein [Limosilactobacillus fermentum]|nr:MucBP domain-containing protein [Limosilactobacillus fermentum]QSH34915.1 MucBP domain-containing protein [Limosilactobacillus fermentum]QSH36953.1 MucBP domain-containing protein [Limosilactobacillus fermentum]QSH38995.1 MucBP domain-containing protein [Limosilactobacillus fermentum]